MRGSDKLELLRTLICVLEADDPNMDGHSLHVHLLTMLMYDYIPLRRRICLNRHDLEYASLLLDIGKHGMPARILHKKGKLGASEWDVVRRHPEIAAQILANIGGNDRIGEWIRYHHERIDGQGYYHLNGDEIPYASRMIAVADTYSSITMERSYKPSLAHQDALSELRHVAGSQLDAGLVDVFCGIPEHLTMSCLTRVRDQIGSYQRIIE